MSKNKVPLKQMYRCMMEVQEAASEVVIKAAGIVGAVDGHCDLLATVMPEAARALRRVVQAKYEELKQAMERLRQL